MLSEDEQAQFVHDFARAFQASAELGQWSVLAQAVTEWRSTAASRWSGQADRLGRLGEHGSAEKH
ncbi:hypothetical protein Amsp01_025610 [Amycolatopsis sp. NBRC 101858]|nr:hypothetical protein Amsp01_025610 [Amycolatopsis sp. NBRC 101858]